MRHRVQNHATALPSHRNRREFDESITWQRLPPLTNGGPQPRKTGGKIQAGPALDARASDFSGR
jgi:hypothetical protein